MLIQIFRSGQPLAVSIIEAVLLVLIMLISLTVHEYSHGRMALALGDKTALMAGRLSLNPIRHLDVIGTLMILIVGFGYAKPVPVNPRNFTKVGYKGGMILVSLAGPLSNFLLALLGMLGLHITLTVWTNSGSDAIAYTLTYLFFLYFTLLNIGLGVFNLIPLPPLDGSRILTVFLPARAQLWFYRYERFIQIGLFALIWLGLIDRPLLAARTLIYNALEWLVTRLPFLL